MTTPDVYLGPTHIVIAETVAAIAHDGQLFAGVESLRRIRSTMLLVQGSNPVWGAQLDERFSLGCDALALRISEQLRQSVPS